LESPLGLWFVVDGDLAADLRIRGVFGFFRLAEKAAGLRLSFGACDCVLVFVVIWVDLG
jgi:hypothetical protein